VQQSSGKFRVRFAPSPTGYLHVGGARTALYNYLLAKKNNGTFVLRIEDTDEERSTLESLGGMLRDLRWLGLNWDEGPHPETLQDMGSFGPYKQSDRQEIYKKYAEQLLREGKAYYCFLTDEELEAQREKNKHAGTQMHIQSPYADWSLEQALERLSKGDKAVVRFKTQHLKKDYHLQDMVRGEVTFPSDMIGDFVLLRSGGMPVYNFCCVIDDHLMEISHVLRAEEHLSNTLRQLMIYEAFGWTLPQFGHFSLILDEDRQKLSKRKGAVACGMFQEEGYLPEALLNFLILLGWSHPEEKEVLSLQEMIDSFSMERVNVSGAVFDRVKLKWMNGMHLRAKPSEELWSLIEPFLRKNQVSYHQDIAWKTASVEAFKAAMEVLTDAVPLYRQLISDGFTILPEASEIDAWETTPAVLKQWLTEIENFARDTISGDEFLQIQDRVKAATGAKGKQLFMPMRVAVVGKPHGTELKLVVPLIHRQELIRRAQLVMERK
jgi:nondiscriminating glutamyl-tRNA synthetase